MSASQAGPSAIRLVLRALPAILLFFCGCDNPNAPAITYYCDGAGWYTSAGSVEGGLRAGGYKGEFHTFAWSALLGPGPDHYLVAPNSGPIAKGLSRRIEKAHEKCPNAAIHVMGLSAGTAIVLSAVEQLSDNVFVDQVVLFSPSVSAQRDLSKAMKHVRGRLYATCSPRDGILNGVIANADGGPGNPAGLSGFQIPSSQARDVYARVINLPWKAGYLLYDWDGGHTSVTSRNFVKTVIAPRVLSKGDFPLDRSISQLSGHESYAWSENE